MLCELVRLRILVCPGRDTMKVARHFSGGKVIELNVESRQGRLRIVLAVLVVQSCLRHFRCMPR